MATLKGQPKDKWDETGNRFVAYLDILGFKELVQRNDHTEVLEILKKIGNYKKAILEDFESEDYADYHAEIRIVSFSDAIIVFSKEDDVDNLVLFLSAVRRLIRSSLGKGIPFKGAMAHGKMSIDFDEQLFFGQPLIDAFQLQEQVNYLGVVAESSLDRYLAKRVVSKRSEEYKRFLFTSKTYLKCGLITHCNINWFNYATNDKTEEYLREKVTPILDKLYLQVSGDSRRYNDNTFAMIDLALKSDSFIF